MFSSFPQCYKLLFTEVIRYYIFSTIFFNNMLQVPLYNRIFYYYLNLLLQSVACYRSYLLKTKTNLNRSGLEHFLALVKSSHVYRAILQTRKTLFTRVGLAKETRLYGKTSLEHSELEGILTRYLRTHIMNLLQSD